MKKLANVSPFLLLSFPVFILMLLAFATSNTQVQQQEEIAAKTSAVNTIVKATTAILR